MKVMTDGLVIRETPVGEADKFVTLLTRDLGVIRAGARGSRKINSRSGAATRLFTHAQLTVQKSRANWYLEDARPLHLFFELKNDIERLALGQYFCELAGALCPREEPAGEHLRLLLNSLHYLSGGERPPLLLKAVTEGWLTAAAGYQPDLGGCSVCGAAEGEFRLLPEAGRLVCRDCPGEGYPLSPGALAALGRIVEGPLERCFSFTLPEGDLKQLAAATEGFMKAQLGRSFATLDFYHTLTT